MWPELFLDIKGYPIPNCHCAFCDCGVNIIRALLGWLVHFKKIENERKKEKQIIQNLSFRKESENKT